MQKRSDVISKIYKDFRYRNYDMNMQDNRDPCAYLVDTLVGEVTGKK
jgi:hypothetical protein